MSEPQKTNFPFKTLIWALFAVLIVFLFKEELKYLLSNTEELTVFGVVIKANKEEAIALETVIHNFEEEITGLSNQITDQQERIKLLNELKRRLEEDVANCPDVKEDVATFNKQFTQIFKSNDALKMRTDKLKDIKMVQRENPVLEEE